MKIVVGVDIVVAGVHSVYLVQLQGSLGEWVGDVSIKVDAANHAKLIQTKFGIRLLSV